MLYTTYNHRLSCRFIGSAKISIFGPFFEICQIFPNFFLKFWIFFVGSKWTKNGPKMSKWPKISIFCPFLPFFALFLQTFAIISKTVHYFILKFCKDLRHNKGLGMECSFWTYNYFLVQNRPKSAFLGPIFEICQIFPIFLLNFPNFFFGSKWTKNGPKM